MNKPLHWILLFGLLAVCTCHAETLESKYFRARDKYFEQFRNTEWQQKDDQQALNDLEQQLTSIIGQVRIEGFPSRGAINIETLHPGEPGADQVDGLMFRSKNDSLFITTPTLLSNYLKTKHLKRSPKRSKLPTELHSLSKSGHFYSYVFNWDVAFIKYMEIPIAKRKDVSIAYAFLAEQTQESTPAWPQELMMFISTKNRIFVAKVDVGKDENTAERCQKELQKLEKTYENRSSNDHLKYLDEGIPAYRKCFIEGARNDGFVRKVTERAQSVLNQLPVN